MVANFGNYSGFVGEFRGNAKGTRIEGGRRAALQPPSVSVEEEAVSLTQRYDPSTTSHRLTPLSPPRTSPNGFAGLLQIAAGIDAPVAAKELT